jgi:hypothetical protein
MFSECSGSAIAPIFSITDEVIYEERVLKIERLIIQPRSKLVMSAAAEMVPGPVEKFLDPFYAAIGIQVWQYRHYPPKLKYPFVAIVTRSLEFATPLIQTVVTRPEREKSTVSAGQRGQNGKKRDSHR